MSIKVLNEKKRCNFVTAAVAGAATTTTAATATEAATTATEAAAAGADGEMNNGTKNVALQEKVRKILQPPSSTRPFTKSGCKFFLQGPNYERRKTAKRVLCH